MTLLLRRCFLALLLVIAIPAQAAGDGSWFYQGSDIPQDKAWTFGTLDNGLRYAVRRNALPAGQVSIRVRIGAGSLHEADGERGWAHFVEHMLFRGTENFPDRQARYVWQKLGASFGSDSNATTSATQTVYQLDLPHADRASLDTSLNVLSEMMDKARFDATAIEGEKRIILQEKARRPELSTKMQEASWPLFYAGLKMADRDPIGTSATLAAANPAGLKAFYERWYRPDNATVVMVGDADPAMMEELIAKHFGAWAAKGAAPPAPDYGAIATPERRVTTLAYPGAPHVISAAWLRPYRWRPATIAGEREDFAKSIASRILNRRLQAKARGEAAFLNAAIGQSEATDVADMTMLSVNAKDGRWREALKEVFAILRDATAVPPSQDEIARELSNIRTNATAAVEGDDTVRSPQRAQQLVGALDDRSVVASARDVLALFDGFGRDMTPDAVAAATRSLFDGAGPRMALLAPEAVSEADAEAALAAAEKIAPATRQADRKISMDNLPPIGAPGREVSRRTIDDLGVTIVTFANGSTLTFKQSDFEKGSVQVQLRFGGGLTAIDPKTPSMGWAAGAIASSGMADLDLDAMERLLTGRRMAMTFAMDDDAFILSGQTNGADLGDQLRLLATKLAFPRWDPQVFGRLRAGALESYELAFASATARASREFGGVLRPDDSRWAPVEKAAVQAADAKAFEAFFAPLTARGPVEGIIVGDVDLETAVEAFARTVGALPKRPEPVLPAGTTAVAPPPPSPDPLRFTHNGAPDEAYAVIGWTTMGGLDHRKERRALSMAANMLQVRLFDRLREEEGATYSPSAISSTSETFPEWGVFYTAAAIKPESADAFFRIAREVVADLAAKPAAADEFARVKNPILTGIERREKTNAYWVGVLQGIGARPEKIDYARNYLADYKAMTAEDVRAAVARYVADAPDWSILVVPGRTK